jgi:hypothetical protein
MDKKLIGRKFWGNLESFSGFGKATIFVSFQGGVANSLVNHTKISNHT